MPKWVYAILCLLFESLAARRDARVRFLHAQVTILRCKLDGALFIRRPSERGDIRYPVLSAWH